MSEQAFEQVPEQDENGVPAQILINTLRGEIANLNDQRIGLMSRLEWLQIVIKSQEETIKNLSHTHDDIGVVEEVIEATTDPEVYVKE